MRSSHFVRRLLPCLTAALLVSAVRGQVLCDSAHTATFSLVGQGGYSYLFTPLLPQSNSTILQMQWGFISEENSEASFSPQPEYVFPGAGDYLVCLGAVVMDDQMQYCSSVYCEVVPIPVEADCIGVLPAFTILPQSGALQFIDQTVSDQPVTGMTWDMGDGTSTTEQSPLHTYGGSGPYEACLTVTTASCMAEACNWIYLGAANVPCDTLLEPAIMVLQYERTVAVFDQSVTSGQNSSVLWDFGDGATVVGSPALHTYLEDGYYSICGNVELWGPLAQDSCNATVCQWISTMVPAGVDPGQADDGVLRAHPVPFDRTIIVEGAPVGPGAHWELTDLLGRIRMTGAITAWGPLVITDLQVEAGCYIIRLHSGQESRSVMVVKD